MLQGYGLWTVFTLLLLLGTDCCRCAGGQAWSQAGYCGGMAVTAADALMDRICRLPGCLWGLTVTAMDTLVGRVDSCPGWLESLAVTAMGMVMWGADLLKREMLWRGTGACWGLLGGGGVWPLGWEKLWEGIGAGYLCLVFLLKLCYCF